MDRQGTARRITGVLLAAGQGQRFGGDKLLARLPHNAGDALGDTPVASAACRPLLAALPGSVAVVRAGATALMRAFEEEGMRVLPFERADEGMGASLAFGVAQTADAAGWVIALADMPWIATSTVRAVAEALERGAPVVAPAYRGARGHPVGFGAALRSELVALRGDQGARSILRAHAGELMQLAVDDPGILRDVDTRADLDAG